MARSKDYEVRGDRIKAIRLRKKLWRQEDLAEAADLSVGQVSRIEAGRHQAQLANVRRIADALGVEVDEIVDWNVELEAV